MSSAPWTPPAPAPAFALSDPHRRQEQPEQETQQQEQEEQSFGLNVDEEDDYEYVFLDLTEYARMQQVVASSAPDICGLLAAATENRTHNIASSNHVQQFQEQQEQQKQEQQHKHPLYGDVSIEASVDKTTDSVILRVGEVMFRGNLGQHRNRGSSDLQKEGTKSTNMYDGTILCVSGQEQSAQMQERRRELMLMRQHFGGRLSQANRFRAATDLDGEGYQGVEVEEDYDGRKKAEQDGAQRTASDRAVASGALPPLACERSAVMQRMFSDEQGRDITEDVVAHVRKQLRGALARKVQ